MSVASGLQRIQFGPFELHLETGELLRHGHRIRLQGQSFQILRVLLERRGRVVTREELQQMLWPADTFVDFDSGLNNAMKRLREVLGDSPERPRYIETLPRKGYRFVGELTPKKASVAALSLGVAAEDRAPPALPVLPDFPLAASVSPGGPRQHRTLWVVAAAAVVVLGALGVLGLRLRTHARGLPPIRSLAVLPLSNLSGDASRDYFAAGVTEQLTTEQGRMEDVRVISRTSADHYKGTTKTLPEIARELGADAVIEGAIAQSADRVRITVQLIRASSDQHLWARAYEGKVEDILQMQDDVARSVAD